MRSKCTLVRVRVGGKGRVAGRDRVAGRVRVRLEGWVRVRVGLG